MNRHKYSQNSQLETHLSRLYGRINYERQLTVTPRHFKLRNMREILKRLGDPHLQYPVVHVAGTKGKGSVTTMVGQILQASGRRTGVYVSPHLERINQRISVDGSMISDDQLVEVLAELEPVCDSLDVEAEAAGYRKLTFFEVTTAAAFLFFKKQKADAVVLEVGLGGRMDSTNVCQPLVSVITNISLDHTRQLGSTLDKIAFEKAGIIKPGIPVISGALAPAAAQVIASVAAENDSPLSLLNQDFQTTQLDSPPDTNEPDIGQPDSESDDPTSDLAPPFKLQPINEFGVAGKVESRAFRIDKINLPMIGQHQRTNAALAVAAIQSLNNRHGNNRQENGEADWNISDDQIREGLSAASLAGRTEITSRKPTVVTDIAHNLASIEAMLGAIKDLDDWHSSKRKTLIFATTRDKDASAMLLPLLSQFDRIVFTKYQNNPRGKATDELLEIAHDLLKAKHRQAVCQTAERQPPAKADDNSEFAENLNTNPILLVSPTPNEAWQLVGQDLSNNDFVCIAGSAFLVAELRPFLLMSQ
jgi:dihydrofolate synthase/folylpolyglutamate synthase